jgi:deoxyribodipyrimidine photo-lyase
MQPLDLFDDDAPDRAPTRAAALVRIAALRPAAYARTRNALDGAVSGLSPYITHGLVTLDEVLDGVMAHHPLDMQHKFVYELGWRAYFRHVWQHRGAGILRDIHEGPLPADGYSTVLPADIRLGCTGVPVIDQAVRTLYATGLLHNHARMWLASYVVHLRKVHWRAGADWLYGHLLDGDLASNHLSWQWVAGTGSSKPYLFNADNVARYAPAAWHSPGSVVDATYELLDQRARDPAWAPGPSPAARRAVSQAGAEGAKGPGEVGSADLPQGVAPEPELWAEPPTDLGLIAPDAAAVQGREVWLVHAWRLGPLPVLPADTLVLGVCASDFHRAWPWSERRWRFVDTRMAEITPLRWFGAATDIGSALATARSVRSIDEPHLSPWLAQWADCETPAGLFPAVDRRCESFSQWWTRASRGLK